MEWYENAALRQPEDFERNPPLKLGSGVFQLKIVDNGREITVPDFKNPEVEVKKVVLTVEMGNVKYAWFVSVAGTTDSLYGQLASVAKKYGGLEGRLLELIVAGQKKERRYNVSKVDGQPTSY